MIPLGTPASQVKHTISPVFQSLIDIPDSDKEFYSEEGWKFILAQREGAKLGREKAGAEQKEEKEEAKSNEQQHTRD